MRYECGRIQCGAVFQYDRQCLGQHVAPQFCPQCGELFVSEAARIKAENMARVSSPAYRKAEKAVARGERSIRRAAGSK